MLRHTKRDQCAFCFLIMSRIFYANMFRLRKSRLLWWSVILTALLTAGAVLLNCLSIEGDMSEYAPEAFALSGAPFVQIANAAVIILFLGTDNSSKTIRNKLIVGNPRGGVFLADVLTGMVIGFLINSAWLIGGLAGVPIMGFWKMELSQALLYIVMSFVCTVSLSAAASLVGVLFRRRSSAIVAVLTSVLLLTMCAGAVYTRLNNKKEVMNGNIINGELTLEVVENPNYIGGFKRMVYELALYVNPLGSSVALSNCDLKNPAAGLTGAAFVTVFVSSLGAAAFRRRDLN